MKSSFLADISDLDGGLVAKVDFPNPNDLTKFNVRVSPDSGVSFPSLFIVDCHFSCVKVLVWSDL